MDRPIWLCGTPEKWDRLKTGMRVFELVTKMKEAPVKWSMGEACAGTLGVTGIAFSVSGNAAIQAFLIAGAIVVSIAATIATTETRQSFGTTLLASLGKKLFKKGLANDNERDLNETLKMAELANEVSSSGYSREMTSLVIDSVISEMSKRSQDRRLEKLKEQDAEEEARIREALTPHLKTAGQVDDLSEHLRSLGEEAADGAAALTIARALLSSKGNDLRENERSELFRVSNELLPKLAAAYGKVPEHERDKKLEELDKSPKEALVDGMAAALERVLKVRTALTNRAKVEVEAERNVLKSGI